MVPVTTSLAFGAFRTAGGQGSGTPSGGGGHITFGGCLAQALTPFTPPLHELSPPFRNCNRSCVAARLAKSPHTWNWTRPTWRSRDRLEKP